MKLSHLNGLRALEATLRKGTFSAAAKELGVTVAAIGQQLRNLEEYLGVTLFERLPRAPGRRPKRVSWPSASLPASRTSKTSSPSFAPATTGGGYRSP